MPRAPEDVRFSPTATSPLPAASPTTFTAAAPTGPPCAPLLRTSRIFSPKAASGTKSKGGGLLVQRSLFQVWGIEKPRQEEASQGVRAGAWASTSSPSPSGAWSGKKRRRGSLEEEWAARKPLACPFYKKIPEVHHSLLMRFGMERSRGAPPILSSIFIMIITVHLSFGA